MAPGPLRRLRCSRADGKRHSRLDSHIRNANSAVQLDVQVSVGSLADRSNLNEATQRIDSIIHCASNAAKAAEDIDGTRALLECAASNGVRYFVYISIVGVDRADALYYKTKRTVEQIVMDSAISSVILRATQFHSFVASLIQKLGADTLDEVMVPAGVRLQTIEAEEVAQRLVELTKTRQTGYVDEVGGPANPYHRGHGQGLPWWTRRDAKAAARLTAFLRNEYGSA